MQANSIHLTPLARLKHQIHRHYEAKEYADFVELANEYVLAHLHNQEEFEPLLIVLQKCLAYFKTDLDKYKKNYLNTLNYLGIMCFYSYQYKEAISFYFIGLLHSNGEQRSRFYANIGDSLMYSNNLVLAAKYFTKALKNIIKEEEEGTYHFSNQIAGNIYALNYVLCLIKMSKLDKAKKIFDGVDGISDLPSGHHSFYLFVECLLNFEAYKEKDFLAVIQNVKHELSADKKNNYVIEFNEFLLENSVEYLGLEMQLEMLTQNYKISKKVNNTAVTRACLVKLIHFYKAANDTVLELQYLRELLALDSADKHIFNDKLVNTYLVEFSELFRELRNINKQISIKKKEFEEITYILSHDLKTPLRTINSFSQLLERDVEKEQYDNLGEYLSLIKNSSKNLYQLIEDVNVLHNIEKYNGMQVAVDLNEVLKLVASNLKELTIAKNAKVLFEDKLPVVRGAATHFTILFQNLVENGLKYNESKLPRVKVLSEIKKEHIIIHFVDNGIGIDADYFEQIFKFFKRLHTKTSYEGTGFGLGICKKIANNYQGEIKVVSEKGKGSVFSLVLPKMRLIGEELL